ncbi:MAG: choice-of-anchor D domain-containing protein, partial [Gemmatimonadota bacterium]
MMKVKTIFLCLFLFLAGAIGSPAQEPDIDLSATIHNYGTLTVGDSLDWVLTIFNVGNDTLFVDSARVDGPQFHIESPAFPDTVTPTPPKDSISVTLWFFPSDTGLVTGSLFVFSDDPDEETLTVVLSGTGILQDIALSESTHDYGHIRVGDSLDWQLTIHNIGTDTLTVDSALVTPSLFQISSPSFPDTVPPVDSTFLIVWFLPTDTGAVVGSLLVFSDDPDEETLTVVLSGTGILQDIAPSDTAHDFGDVALGDSLDWVVTLYNEGTADLIVDSVLSAPTEFGVTAPLLPDTLVPEDSILVTITFSPSSPGAVAGSLLVFSDDPDEGLLTIDLLGNGVIPDIAVSDTSHDYGDVPAGDSLDWILTIYNWGTGSLSLDSVLLEPSEFEIICTSFPQTIPAVDSIGVIIRFKPTDWGAVAGSLLVFSNDPDEDTLTISLAGNGLAPDIESPVLVHNFGDVEVGDSADWTTQISNPGNLDLVLDSVLAVPPDFIIISPLFPDSIAPADTLAMTITFAPSDTGAVTGSLLVFSNDPDEGIFTITLGGNGLAPIIAVSESDHDFGDVFVGDSLGWDLWVINIGTADLILDSLLTTPVEFEVSTPPLPDTLSVGDSLAATITFLPTDTGAVTGTLLVYSSDPYQGVLSLTLTGRGVVSEITLFPDSLAATIWEGGIISQPLTIINEGTALLLFTTSDTVSWLSENPDSGGVDPSDTITVDIIFDATLLTIGEYDDVILVTSNDPDEPELTIYVHLVVREAQVIVAIPDAWSLPGDTVTMTLNIDNQTERDDPIAAFQS